MDKTIPNGWRKVKLMRDIEIGCKIYLNNRQSFIELRNIYDVLGAAELFKLDKDTLIIKKEG